jgi:hypothetical protein
VKKAASQWLSSASSWIQKATNSAAGAGSGQEASASASSAPSASPGAEERVQGGAESVPASAGVASLLSGWRAALQTRLASGGGGGNGGGGGGDAGNEGGEADKAKDKERPPKFVFRDLETAGESQFEPPPERADDVVGRTLWLLRAASATARHPIGAFLSQRLFFPREAWLQEGARIPAFSLKIASLEAVADALREMARDKQEDAWADAAALALPKLRAVQTHLAFQVACVHEWTDAAPGAASASAEESVSVLSGGGGSGSAATASPRAPARAPSPLPLSAPSPRPGAEAAAESKSETASESELRLEDWRALLQKRVTQVKSLGYSVAKGASRLGNRALATKLATGDGQRYAEALCEVANAAQFLGRVPEPLPEPVARVARFLQEVVCEFVLEDLKALLHAYLHLASDSFAT